MYRSGIWFLPIICRRRHYALPTDFHHLLVIDLRPRAPAIVASTCDRITLQGRVSSLGEHPGGEQVVVECLSSKKSRARVSFASGESRPWPQIGAARSPANGVRFTSAWTPQPRIISPRVQAPPLCPSRELVAPKRPGSLLLECAPRAAHRGRASVGDDLLLDQGFCRLCGAVRVGRRVGGCHGESLGTVV